jgi:CPA1 family monovalent cation:H+ antiporter
MDSVATIFILMFAAVLLVGIAQKFHVPYPLALIIGGTAISFIPYLSTINFDSNLILLIVLPPILYYAAFGISFREFKKNWKDIFSLALGLVVATTVVIAIIFKWMFPEYSWALAFAFGAIVSPPDAIAATTILKRFEINSRLVTLLEGESLINDASALVLYKVAVTALISGVFTYLEAGQEFVQAAFGGLLLGFISGLLFQLFSRRYLEPILGVLFSFTIPYITFIIANLLGVSGVLAVVVNGLIGSQILLTHHSSLRRIIGFAVWDIFIILMNCFVFILIGLQLKTVTSLLTRQEMALYTGYALLISFAMFLVRFIWVFGKSGFAYFKALNKPKSSTTCPQILRDAALVSWSGMRGIVSLAAAMGLPYVLPNGMPLEGRNEVIFITFLVILITLLVPGLSLPSLITWLKIQRHEGFSNAGKVRNQLAKVAAEKLHYLFSAKHIDESEFDFLKTYFIVQPRVLEMSHEVEYKVQNIETARIKVIQAQRKKLFEIWKKQEIDDRLLTHLENELDMVEVHIARAELK